MSIQEKYAASVRSTNLRDDEHHHQTDVLMAMALSPVQMGTLLYRVKYAQDQTSLVSLLAAWVARLTRRAERMQWPSHVRPGKIAHLSVEHYLNPLCPVCHGRGYEVKINEHGGIDRDCNPCNSTGRKKIMADNRLRQYVVDAVASLEDLERIAAYEANKKLHYVTK